MNRDNIAVVLKQLRTESGLTQKEAAQKLGKKQQTVASWETGQSQPDANTLFIVCNLYNTTVDEAFGFKKKDNDNVSHSELEVIKKYRALDEHGTKIVDSVLNEEYNRVVSEPEKERKYTMSDVQRLLNEYEDKENKKLTLVAHGAFSDTVTVTEEQLKRAKKILDSGDY